MGMWKTGSYSLCPLCMCGLDTVVRQNERPIRSRNIIWRNLSESQFSRLYGVANSACVTGLWRAFAHPTLRGGALNSARRRIRFCVRAAPRRIGICAAAYPIRRGFGPGSVDNGDGPRAVARIGLCVGRRAGLGVGPAGARPVSNSARRGGNRPRGDRPRPAPGRDPAPGKRGLPGQGRPGGRPGGRIVAWQDRAVRPPDGWTRPVCRGPEGR